ncbi:MAG: heme-binding protein [Sphingorhabdus sp.]
MLSVRSAIRPIAETEQAILSVTAVATVTEHKDLSLSRANQLAGTTIESWRAGGRSAFVALVDRGGNIVAIQRGDNIGPHNPIAAQGEAFTALSTKTGATKLSQRAENDPASKNLTTISELLLLGGGFPLPFRAEIIGGIGVAGQCSHRLPLRYRCNHESHGWDSTKKIAEFVHRRPCSWVEFCRLLQ